MPRELPTGLVTLLKSGFAETHSTLAISLLGQGRSIRQTIYLATAAEGGGSAPPSTSLPTPPIVIPNAGFETPILPPPGYQYAPAGSSWSWPATSGIIQGSLFGAGPAAEGLQGAFLQQTGSFLQALTGFVGGTNYELRFKVSQQIPGQVAHDFNVYLDATLLAHITPASSAFEQVVIPFTAGQSTYTLKFQGVNTLGGTVSSILDDVQIVAAPGGIDRGGGGRGIAYQPRLRQTGPVAMSLTRSADRCDIVIENIDRLAGHDYVSVQDALYGSFAEFGRIWRDLRNPQNTYQVTLLTGQIVAARASEMEVQLTIMSDIYSSGAIAGQILYGRSCPWTFKDPATCAYVGPLATCNKLLDDPDGCSGRANEFHFGGFPYIKGRDTISDAAGIQANLQYQTIIQPAALSDEELRSGAKATTAIIQRHNLLLQGFTITDSPADDATKIVAGGVGGANYQTLKENDGYSYVRVLPPEPTLNFLNSFKLKDDPTNLETDITTYGVPTGTLNVRTDFNASGSIDVANVVSFNIGGIVTLDAVLNLQPGMGVLVEGAGIGGVDFIGTVGSVSTDGKTYVLTAAFPTAPPSGARVQADDTVAVQGWITAHGDLAMPPGYYRLSSSIIIPTTSEGFSVIVHGSGWDLSQFVFQHGGDGFVPTLPDLKVDSLVFKDLSIVTGTKWAGPTIDPNNHGYGIRMTAPGYLGVYNNFVLERCRVLGWGCFGIISDNMEVSWINNCIFRENRFGHVAFVAPDQLETAKLPNANVLRSNAFDQAFGGGDAHRTASGSMTKPPAAPTPAQTDAARAISFGGVSLTAADRGRIVIVAGAGTNNSALYSFIDVVLTATTAKLAHAAQTTVSGQTVEIFSSSIASIFLNRAHDTIVDGGTIQGNFTLALPSEECNAIRADECFNLRVVGVHEEDAGGNGGSAIRLANCIAVTIENWGGTSAGPGLTNAHNADFQIINSHGVSVKNCFFNDRPQFVVDDTSSEVQIDDSWIVGYNNLWQADRSWDRLRIGSGVRTAQTAESRTAQLAGNEYSYDGFFGRDLVLNGQFLDGSDGFEGWTKASSWISRTAISPFQGGTYINVDATAGGDNPAPTQVLEQVVAIPDVVGPGPFTLGFNWNLDEQAGTEQTGRFCEVRLHPSSGTDEAIQWSTRPYPVVQDVWQVGHVRCFLGSGAGRTIAIRINVTPGPNNVRMHFANFRLASGKHIFGSWERGISDFGGRMRAPLEMAPITNPPYPPPPPGSPIISIANIGGVLNIGKNGAYVPVTPGGPGTITGPPGYYAVYNAAGTGLDYASLKQETTGSGIVHVLNVPLWIDRDRALMSTYSSTNAAASLVVFDSTNVAYFGPEFDANGAQAGGNVIIRAAHGDVSSLQISGSGRRMTFNAPLALPGMTGTLPTFFVGISDLNLEGLRIQQTTAGFYFGYMLSCYFSATASDALFAVNQLGEISRLKNLSYIWPGGHASGFLQNNGTGSLSWGGAGGHTIQEESTPLPTRPALNFVGLGIQAVDIPPPDANPRTNVTLFTASVFQEGTVSTGIQDFTGHKSFHRGAHFFDDAGGVQVPLVAQMGSGATAGAHIQEWWLTGGASTGLIAYIDTQPVLRLGIPGPAGRAGFLELCTDTQNATVILAAAVNPAPGSGYRLHFPGSMPLLNQYLQVASVGGSNPGVVWLQWQTISPSGSGNVTVTAPQGIDNRIPRWSGPAAPATTTVLEDSAIEDRTSGGTGTVEIDAGTLLLRHAASGAAEVVDFYMRTPAGFSTIWRYDRRTGFFPPNGIADGLNTDELQLHFGNFNSTPTILGTHHSWFQGGLRVRPTGGVSGNSGTIGNAFEVQDTTGVVKLAVAQSGNLAAILGISYNWPTGHAAGSLLNDGSGGLSWGGAAGHVIQDEGGPITYRSALNFTGGGVLAANHPTIPRTDITIFTATTAQEGTVSTGTQDFGGHKYFHRGLHAWEDTGGSAVPLVCQVGTVAAANSGAHIQEWSSSALLAYIDTQPTFRLGNPAVAGGILELCSSAASPTVKLSAAVTPTVSYSIRFPPFLGSAGQVLSIADAGGNMTWATAGAGAGANVQLSNLDASGSAVTPSTSINTHLGFSVDGGWNIGAPTHRVGSMYLLGTFFMYPTGSTNPSSPKAFGFLDPQVGEYTKVLLSGNAHICQGGNGQRLQFTSYHSFEFRGNRRNNGLGTPLAFFAPSGNDSSSMLVYLDRNAGAPDCIPLLINTDQAIASDLFRCQMQTIDRFRVGPQGSIVSKGGTQFKAKEIQPGGAGATTAISTDWRTVIVDTWFGYHTLILPSAQANPGMIVDVIHMRAVQSILGLVQGRDQAIYIQTTGFTGGPDVFNAWAPPASQATQFILAYPGTNGLPAIDNQHKMVRLIADESLAIWWLMPYYL